VVFSAIRVGSHITCISSALDGPHERYR
jgi:hypothetical protein